MLLPPGTLCGCIGGAIVSLLTYNAVDHWFKSKPGQTKDYKIGNCCFFAKNAALRSKRKDWLAENKDY
jgi:hypothetical protein